MCTASHKLWERLSHSLPIRRARQKWSCQSLEKRRNKCFQRELVFLALCAFRFESLSLVFLLAFLPSAILWNDGFNCGWLFFKRRIQDAGSGRKGRTVHLHPRDTRPQAIVNRASVNGGSDWEYEEWQACELTASLTFKRSLIHRCKSEARKAQRRSRRFEGKLIFMLMKSQHEALSFKNPKRFWGEIGFSFWVNGNL